MATYTIRYKFGINDTVWINESDCRIVECTICRIILDVDPDDTGTIKEKRTYHLDPIYDMDYKISLRSEDELFASLEDVLEYRITGVKPQYPDQYSIDYYYTIDDIVWIVDKALALESEVKQLTYVIDSNGEETWYHVLPTSINYHTLLKQLDDLFETEQDALDYIRNQRATPVYTLTPTPTPELTTTPTPTVTPSIIITTILDQTFINVLDQDYNVVVEQ